MSDDAEKARNSVRAKRTQSMPARPLQKTESPYSKPTRSATAFARVQAPTPQLNHTITQQKQPLQN